MMSISFMPEPELLEGAWDWHTDWRQIPAGNGFPMYVLEVTGKTMLKGTLKTGRHLKKFNKSELDDQYDTGNLAKFLFEHVADSQRTVRIFLESPQNVQYHVLDFSEVPRPDLDSAASKEMPKPDIEGTAPAE
jgi:hypothetical protein